MTLIAMKITKRLMGLLLAAIAKFFVNALKQLRMIR
jgi:small neutral amino acid transporter SnatA (MarC family)